MADIKLLVDINAPVEKVYRAISTIPGITNWWARETTGDSNEGGTIDIRFGDEFFNTMKVTQLKPDSSVSWECIDGHDDWKGTTLKFKLESASAVTRVRFAHEGWKNTDDFYAKCTYGWGWYIESLKQYCETGKGKPFEEKIKQ